MKFLSVVNDQKLIPHNEAAGTFLTVTADCVDIESYISGFAVVELGVELQTNSF